MSVIEMGLFLVSAASVLTTTLCVVLLFRRARNVRKLAQAIAKERESYREQVANKDGQIRALDKRIRELEVDLAGRHEIGVMCFVEHELNKGVIWDDCCISYKMQLMVDNLPIGSPIVVKEDKVSQVDKKQLNKFLDDFAKPLIEGGVRVTKLLCEPGERF